MPDSYLPPNLDPGRIIGRIGLISDTHMPERWPSLPPSIFDIFHGVDLLLHSGDVGKLWVLDELSRIAPVIAVHGNDETPEATRELPYQQLITVAGLRILLWHSHYPDRIDEMASRHYQDWLPKLDRIAERGRRAGAGLVVYGHTHIPLVYRTDDVWLINPGAIASGNHFTRQLHQTIALLFIRDDGECFITHIDLAPPQPIFQPKIDLEAGFQAAFKQFEAPILSPELLALGPELGRTIFGGSEVVRGAFTRICHRCWAGEQATITPGQLLAEIRQDPAIPPADRERIERLLS
jgi:putative phosphoesterase